MASPLYKAQEEGWSLSLGMEISKGFKEKGETIWTKQVKQNIISFLASYWNYGILGLKGILIISCHVVSRSVESDSAAPWTGALWDPLSMEVSRQEYWSGLLLPTSGDLSDPGMEPEYLISPALASGFFTTSAT